MVDLKEYLLGYTIQAIKSFCVSYETVYSILRIQRVDLGHEGVSGHVH